MIGVSPFLKHTAEKYIITILLLRKMYSQTTSLMPYLHYIQYIITIITKEDVPTNYFTNALFTTCSMSVRPSTSRDLNKLSGRILNKFKGKKCHNQAPLRLTCGIGDFVYFSRKYSYYCL